MGTPKSYERWGKDYGLELVEYADLTKNFEIHYGLVRPPPPLPNTPVPPWLRGCEQLRVGLTLHDFISCNSAEGPDKG